MSFRVVIGAFAAVGLLAVVSGAVGQAQAAFPGANGLIAFTRETATGYAVATVRPDRSGLQTLIPHAAAPAWSADGQQLAYERKTARGDWDIFIANADGSNERELVDPGIDDDGPKWSPDGTQLAFDDGEDIYVISADGTNRRALTTDHDENWGPVWSPDGQWIAFISENGNITLIHPDGSDRHDVVDDGTDSNPSWSPDGTEIAYDASGPHGGWDDIYVAAVDAGSKSRELTDTPTYEGHPVWSPDGTQIIYTLYTTRNGMTQRHSDLYIINADGTNRRPLVRGPAAKYGADWQPLR